MSLLGFRSKAKSSVEELLRQHVTADAAKHHPHGSRLPSRPHTKTTPKKIKSKAITSKTVQWPVLPQVQMKPGQLSPLGVAKKGQPNPYTEILKEKPISRKSTPAHEEIIRNRDIIFEVR